MSLEAIHLNQLNYENIYISLRNRYLTLFPLIPFSYQFSVVSAAATYSSDSHV